MNKKKFIEKLETELGYNHDKCILINDILEENFIISKKNKEKIIEDLKEKLNIDDNEADNIYNISVSIITTALKNKIKHPFS